MAQRTSRHARRPSITCLVAILAGLGAARPAAPTPEAQLQAAVVQYAVQEPDAVGIDAERVADAARKAAAAGAKLVVFPELTFYRTHPWEQNGVTIRDLAAEYPALAARFGALAKELGVALVIGVWEPSDDPGKPVHNTAVFLGPDGTILGKHRKVNPAAAEYDFVKPGSDATGDATPFATPFGRVGMLIGKDMATRFWPNVLAAKKPDLVIALLADVERGVELLTHTSAAARCPGLAANRAAPYAGASGALDARGNLLRQAGGAEETLMVTVPSR